MKCMKCGNETREDLNFCIHCGAKVKGVSTNSYTANASNEIKEVSDSMSTGSSMYKPDSHKESKNVSRIVIIIVVVLIGLFAVFHLTDRGLPFNINKKGGTKSNQTSQLKETESDYNGNMENTDLGNTDVETMVLNITNKRNRIVELISAGEYDYIMADSNISAYSDNSKIVYIFTDKSQDDYKKSFYYDDGKLICAEYDGSEAHQFYFDNNEMIRWRYSANSSNNKNATNYDKEDATAYLQWENRVISESNELISKCEYAEQNAPDIKEYMLPGSDSRYISESELSGFTAEQCSIARNEIYARHGRKFKKQELQDYFNQFDWYVPSIEPDNFNSSVFNAYELANIDVIVKYEKDHGYR